MKSISRQLGPEVLFKATVDNFAFPGTDLSGEKAWFPSNYPFGSLFSKLLADEALFEAIRKSKGVAYVFDKTLSTIKLRHETPTGVLFYAWIRHAGTPLPSDKYELSAESGVLGAIAQQLALTPERFSPLAEPMAGAIGARSNALQGEVIDAFACRAYEMMQRAAFKEQSKSRLKEIQSATSKTERYFGRLENNCPSIIIQRFELHYRPEAFAGVTLHENAKHLDETIAKLLDQAESSGLIGYWWKRRYLPEHGLGIHLILLTEARVGQSITLVTQQVTEAWNEKSKQQGTIFELTHQDDEGNHRCWGAKLTNVAGASFSPLQTTFNSIRMMLESDKYIRLKPHPNIAHWGMGELPPVVVAVTPAWEASPTTASVLGGMTEAIPAVSAAESVEPPTHDPKP